MGLLDVLTGGNNEDAKNALNKAQKNFEGIPVPTEAQLTLPELQQYVQAGILTPAQAQTFLQDGNAFNDIKLDPSTTENEQDVIGKLKSVSDAKGMTPAMRAQLTAALDQVATATHGTNSAISDKFSARGIPSSLMAEAGMREEAGNDARSANLTATQAAGTAEQNALNALSAEGNLASTMHGQQSTEAQNKAAAENAMREWNAGSKNTTSEANANRSQTANEYNAKIKQDTSNANTGQENQRTQYNAAIPETIFGNQITKAGGQAGVAGHQADQSTATGNQQMGLYGSLIGAGGEVLAAADGAVVPGHAEVPGDSPRNDKVHAMLSPGEVVVPRSVAPHPEMVKRFVQHLMKNPVPPAHPDDVHSVLEALNKRREVGSVRG